MNDTDYILPSNRPVRFDCRTAAAMRSHAVADDIAGELATTLREFDLYNTYDHIYQASPFKLKVDHILARYDKVMGETQ